MDLSQLKDLGIWEQIRIQVISYTLGRQINFIRDELHASDWD